MRIDGRYDPIDDEEEQQLEDFANLLLDAIDEMEQSTDEHKAKYLIQFYLDAISVISRCFPQYKQEAANYMQKVSDMVLDAKCQKTDKVTCYYFMTMAWFFTFADKHAQLLNCMLDVYYEMGELDRCTELVGEIDKIIEDSKDYRIYRDVDPNLRRILFSERA